MSEPMNLTNPELKTWATYVVSTYYSGNASAFEKTIGVGNGTISGIMNRETYPKEWPTRSKIIRGIQEVLKKSGGDLLNFPNVQVVKDLKIPAGLAHVLPTPDLDQRIEQVRMLLEKLEQEKESARELETDRLSVVAEELQEFWSSRDVVVEIDQKYDKCQLVLSSTRYPGVRVSLG